MKKQRYKIIEEFKCCGKNMITIRIGDNVHVMEYDEWRKFKAVIIKTDGRT